MRIVATYALSTLTARTANKSAPARTALLARLRTDGATVQQDGLVFRVIVPATTNHSARTARASANALTMPPAIRKTAHARVQLASLANFAKTVAR